MSHSEQSDGFFRAADCVNSPFVLTSSALSEQSALIPSLRQRDRCLLRRVG